MNEDITFGGGKNSGDWIKEKMVQDIEVYIVKNIVQASYEADMGMVGSGKLKYFSYVLDYENDKEYHEWHGEGLISYLSSLNNGNGYALYATVLTQEKFDNINDEGLIDSPLVWWMGDVHVDGSFIAGPDLLFWLWEFLNTGVLPHVWHPDKIDFVNCVVKDKDVLEAINPERFSNLLNSKGWIWDLTIFIDEDSGERQGTKNKSEIKKFEKKGMKKLVERWYKEIEGRKNIVDVPGYIEGRRIRRMREALDVYAETERISSLTALLELGVNITKDGRNKHESNMS